VAKLVLLFVRVCKMVFPNPFAAPLMLAGDEKVQLNVLPLMEELKAMFVAVLEQIEEEFGVAMASGLGFTVMLYVDGVPAQAAAPVVVAMAVKLITMGAMVVLISV
jgi:hypothetical protein